MSVVYMCVNSGISSASGFEGALLLEQKWCSSQGFPEWTFAHKDGETHA